MRPLEGSLVLILSAIAFLRLLDRTRLSCQVLIGAGVVILILHLFKEGAHFQVIPAYFALFLLCALFVMPEKAAVFRGVDVQKVAALSALVLCGVSAAMSYALPMFVLPKPTGPYPVGTRILYLTDESRLEDAGQDPQSKRRLAVQLWYPAEPSKNRLASYRLWAETKLKSSYQSVIWTNSRVDAPMMKQGGALPILIYNHGSGGRRTGDTFLTEDLASHGYVVAAIDHTYNAARVAFPDGRVLEAPNFPMFTEPGFAPAVEVRKAWDKELEKWVADQVFVLDALALANLSPDNFFYGRLNTNLVGAFGHSFGGSASLLASCVDPRIRSAANMDGWTFGGLRCRTSAQPILLMYARASGPKVDELHSLDRGARIDAELDVDDQIIINTSLKVYGGYRLFLTDATHEDFTDQPLTSPLRRFSHRGAIPAARMESILRSYMLAFFDESLAGRGSSLLDSGNVSPFHEVAFETWLPSKEAPPPAK